ncbi:MAG: Uncharacterized protein XD91_0284 [Clostridiales bacterium 38_11]|nr:MAG: Uncharacterized protein XD91_0284 [Clostridiales bacterium 38_11]HBH13236.1 alcohol dehydrogenase [Clostridiales bacterium]
MNKAFIRIRHLTFKLIVRILRFPEPDILSGKGQSSSVYKLMLKNNCKKPLVVTDKMLIKMNIIDGLIESMRANKVDYVVFNGVQPNPTIDNIEAGVNFYMDNKCDSVIAFGGGSSIDCAKIIAAKITNKKDVYSMKGLFKIRKKLPYLVAIPTTAGTGSEATIAAVITNEKTFEKFAINDTKLIPSAYCLDPELLADLPKGLTASTGMDALTHAIEAYIGWNGTSSTDKYAVEAVKIIFDSLQKSYEDGKNLVLRQEMLLASNYAGRAFTRASIGYVHAIAHNLGGLYNLPHGLANAIVLPYILEVSKGKAYKKMARLARETGIVENTLSDKEQADVFIGQIRHMNMLMGIPQHVPEIRERDIPYLAERIEKEGNPAYPVPRILNKKDFEIILNRIRGNVDENQSIPSNLH